jgi:hypothetical protein
VRVFADVGRYVDAMGHHARVDSTVGRHVDAMGRTVGRHVDVIGYERIDLLHTKREHLWAGLSSEMVKGYLRVFGKQIWATRMNVYPQTLPPPPPPYYPAPAATRFNQY